jgi:hypothetical protein
MIPAIEDIVWAELLVGPAVKSRVRNQRVIDQFASNGWVKHTSRKEEYEITESGRQIAEKRLGKHWPTWREGLNAFRIAGLSPEDLGAWRLLRRQAASQLPRQLKQVNRRTLNAWLRRHSKISSGVLPEAFANVQVTVDEVTRMRLPPRSKLLLKDGESIDCDLLTMTFGEIAVPERAWKSIRRIDSPQSNVVISIENKGAFIDFPQVAKATLVFLPGDNISALREVISRTHKQPILHFGDLDADGIGIFEAMLADGFTVEHFVPDFAEEFILTHAQDSETRWPARDYSLLHPAVSKLASRGLWLEQEALVLDHRLEREIRSTIERISNNAA